VTGASERRGPASLARTLYEDLSPAQEAVTEPPPRKGARPTKRDRRHLDLFRDEPF
jgi:ribosome-associated heat shock protein Hsp15